MMPRHSKLPGLRHRARSDSRRCGGRHYSQLSIPTIGIGAGPHCDGQVLVLYDLLGLFDDFVPKFVKPYAHLKVDALQALRRYKEEVEQGKFPI